MSRLSIDLTPEQHKKIKAVAAMQGKSIKDYVLTQILPAFHEEEEALNELEALLDKRIQSAQSGRMSRKSVEDIFQEAYNESTG